MRYARGTSEFDRSLGFFDAVFGFALTLLIANIDMPPAAAWEDLGSVLSGGFGTQLLGFLISFVVIVAFWRANQELIARLRSFDSPAVIWNIALVGLVIFIPFTTQGISDPAVDDLPVTTVLYAVNVAAAILVQTFMYRGAMRRGLGRVHVPAEVARAEFIDALLKPAVFIISIPIAILFGGTAGKLTWLLLLVVGPVSGRFVRRVAQEAGFDPERETADG
ncbi:TMEM175 family protein [Agromyces aerolatus]|uniref:TMEM175 family protein n=1 Tax=Agromyces sp. LY-1074 TaxID=3074080 RepID=UPI00285CCEFE|nr:MULTISPECIES: TMEM175 family protein [unclassified Agromyces]MDR5700922.1 TMEM175 family protein [Agromyces sp. LY-1074]MDR5707417.1 TMEM175 family protein [Agromyces sp. LY-1358]